MIVKFCAKNFRSISEEIELSCLGESSSVKERHGFNFPEWGIKVLPAFGVFGPNASGKSNVLKALTAIFSLLVKGRVTNGNNRVLMDFGDIAPFKFDSKAIAQPTCFELSFISNEKFFVYTLHILQEKVVFEALKVVDKVRTRGKLETLYKRDQQEPDNNYYWEFSENQNLISQEHYAAYRSIKPDRLFLSYLIETFSIEILEGLLVTFSDFIFLSPHQRNLSIQLEEVLKKTLVDSPKLRRIMSDFISELDIGIKGFEIGDDGSLYTHHENRNKEIAKLAFKEESDGTKFLLSIVHVILTALFRPIILVLDEINAHFHPFITEKIIELFQNLKTNKHSQIFFTCHDSYILKRELLGPDQIYLTSRGHYGETDLAGVFDYDLNSSISFEKAYFDGRLQGLPVLRNKESYLSTIARIVKQYGDL